jgi:hypothetical protein
LVGILGVIGRSPRCLFLKTLTVIVGTGTGRITVVTPGGKGKSKTDFTVT